jgi:hypothetical protein
LVALNYKAGLLLFVFYMYRFAAANLYYQAVQKQLSSTKNG